MTQFSHRFLETMATKRVSHIVEHLRKMCNDKDKVYEKDGNLCHCRLLQQVRERQSETFSFLSSDDQPARANTRFPSLGKMMCLVTINN